MIKRKSNFCRLLTENLALSKKKVITTVKGGVNTQPLRKATAYIRMLLFFLCFILTGISGCQSDFERVSTKAGHSQKSRLSTTSARIDRTKAVELLNEFLQKDIYPFTASQVERISSAAFQEWMQSNKIDLDVKNRLQPVLTSPTTEYVLLKNVTLKENNKRTTIALIGVPAHLQSQFTSVVVLEGELLDDIAVPTKTCLYNKCICIGYCCDCALWMRRVKITQSCPSNECSSDYGCGVPCGDKFSDIGEILIFC